MTTKLTEHEITVKAILEIEAYTRGNRLFKFECPSCGAFLDNHVRHAERCTLLRSDIQESIRKEKK